MPANARRRAARAGKKTVINGTGTAPVNGAAATGSVASSTTNFTSATASAKVPFVLQGIVSGLALGTAVWIDVELGILGGGSAAIENVSVTVEEIL